MKETKDSFLGKGWAFPPAFNNVLGTVEMVEDEEDIRQSVRIILGTIPGERIMFPSFGCGIRMFVFESNDPTHLSMLKDTIYDALLYNEPRIKLDRIDIVDDTQMNGLLHIHILYTIIITNTRNNMVIPFYLSEGTNL
ncbi:MAG: GPW/gp25 family protein [Bacteroidia bacterium]